jgi:hypothetical protein
VAREKTADSPTPTHSRGVVLGRTVRWCEVQTSELDLRFWT